MTMTTTTLHPSTSTDPPTHTDTSPRQAAKIAGVSYVLLFVLGIFANFFVREGLIVSGDAQATAANIAESEGLFRLGLVSFLAIFVLDVIVAWALYILFRNANRDVSLLAAWFRIVYTVFLGVAAVFFFQALQLLSGSDFLTVFDSEQLNAEALVALDTFNATWLVGLVGFGIHLMFLGYLVIRSGFAPKALGYVLITAGAGYVLDTTANALLGNYNDYESLFLVVVAVPSIIGEGWLGLWLLLKAGKPANFEIDGPTARSAAS
ncbi:MAG: hypothetical protein ACI9N0_000538 [Ilumatobacter sp.]|jgi:hypothetical protein